MSFVSCVIGQVRSVFVYASVGSGFVYKYFMAYMDEGPAAAPCSCSSLLDYIAVRAFMKHSPGLHWSSIHVFVYAQRVRHDVMTAESSQ